jgi:TolB protein
VDGQGARYLTRNEFNPAWSPKGDRIAFRSDASGHPDLWLIDATGKGLSQMLFSKANDDEPAWSPDGTRIAFVSNRQPGSDGARALRPSQPYNLYIFDLQTKVTVPVAENNLDDRYPSWKPGPASSL